MPVDAISSVTEKERADYMPPMAGGGGKAAGKGELSPEDQQKVEDLKKRDTEVRMHEQAHLTAAGGFAKGGAAFKFETGPDGQRYAIGGEVEIDTSTVQNDPAATIKKAQTIKKAALAPAHPSGQDRAVASQADRMEQQAQQELLAQQQEEATGYGQTGQKSGGATKASRIDVAV